MNLENVKTSDLQKLVLNLADKKYLNRTDKYMKN